METLEAQRTLKDVLQVLEAHNCQPWLLFPAKLSLRMEEKKNHSPQKTQAKAFYIH